MEQFTPEQAPQPDERRLVERDPHMEERWKMYTETAEALISDYDEGKLNRKELSKRIAALNMFLETKASLSSTTPLYNGAYFKENMLEPAILEMHNDPESKAYLGYVDVDNLKIANGLAGHAGGDKYLEAVTVALQAAVQEMKDIDITLAHLSGDEFSFLVKHNDRMRAAEFSVVFLRKLRSIMNSSPIFVEGELKNLPKNTSASIGIRAMNGQTDAEAALHEADLAMFFAKQLGKGQTVFYEDMSKEDQILARTISKKEPQ